MTTASGVIGSAFRNGHSYLLIDNAVLTSHPTITAADFLIVN